MTDSNYPVSLVHRVCCLAGNLEFLDRDASAANQRLAAAIERHDTAALFDWLVETMSYQGIADRIAHEYMQRYGKARWARINAGLSRNPSCPKLTSYWQFASCGYRKGARTCNEPQLLPACPLPALRLRNGNLNQMASALGSVSIVRPTRNISAARAINSPTSRGATKTRQKRRAAAKSPTPIRSYIPQTARLGMSMDTSNPHFSDRAKLKMRSSGCQRGSGTAIVCCKCLSAWVCPTRSSPCGANYNLSL
jgi:hypothetical protein